MARKAGVEEKMSAKKWDKIDYSAVPSQASRIYRNAFKKHDEERYNSFIEKAEKGEVKINAKTLYPYQTVLLSCFCFFSYRRASPPNPNDRN